MTFDVKEYFSKNVFTLNDSIHRSRSPIFYDMYKKFCYVKDIILYFEIEIINFLLN